jgi:adenosylcobinamide-phosphate synthase
VTAGASGRERLRTVAGAPRRLPPVAAGLVVGEALDLVLGDPPRGHPVAAFGWVAITAERRLYVDARGPGVAYTILCLGSTLALGRLAQRAVRRVPAPGAQTVFIAAVAWTVLGGASLGRAADRVARALARGDVEAARGGLRHLCARDPGGLDADDLARATVESVAENTSDAVVAPLLWGAVAGVPGMLGYRAVNTLDAMVGYRSARYQRFGWASARLDDAVNWVPARVTAALTVALAPLVGGDARGAWRAWRRDGGRHPSPNAGRCEAAFAGALGIRLGGRNTYHGRVEDRPSLGEGRAATREDIQRAIVLSRLVGAAATIASAVLAAALHHASLAPPRGDHAMRHQFRGDHAMRHRFCGDHAMRHGHWT